jgi:glycosidase
MRSQKNAEYLSNLKMYFLLLRSFDGKGNVFDDIVSLLPKFKKMGINTLWLSPPQPQTAAGPPMFALNDHGYWPSDHGKIDPVLGGEAAFEHLIQEASWQGIEIAVDAVLNHFGYADRVVLNGKEISTSNPNYFVIIPNIQSTYNHHGELNWKIEGTSNIAEILQYREELSQYPLFNLPTLRKDNPEVRTYVLDSYKNLSTWE